MDYEQEQLYINIGKLASKEIQGIITSEEKRYLEGVFRKNPALQAVYDELSDEKYRENLFHDLQAFDGQAAFKRFGQKIKKRSARNWIWLGELAAALLFLISGTAIYFYNQRTSDILIQPIAQDIGPGSNKATLRLSDGRVIELGTQQSTILSTSSMNIINKNGQLIYQVKGEHGYEFAGKYNTVSTPLGGQYQVTLPDGSKVWLNAGSTLTYAPSLRERGDDKRRVRLTGEAYFQIAKDKLHPFIVTTKGQEVEVLGTHFNLNSYENEDAIRTTLLEGSVRVHALSVPTKAFKVLRPGEQAVFKGNNIKVTQADTETITAWKNGLFAFKDADVPTIMRQLSRWYNVEVEYSSTVPTNLITGGIERNNNLTTAMKMLELVGIKYKLLETGSIKKIIIN